MPAESVAPDVAGAGAWADERAASFRVAYPQYRLAGIRLQTDFRLAPGLLDFRRTGDDWLRAPAGPGTDRTVEVPAPEGVLAARIWGPAGVPDSEPLPLLVVHDGPEYDTLADLTRYLSAGLAGAWLPPVSKALLARAQLAHHLPRFC